MKDKVNVSRVCVAALERELDRLEAPPSLPAPQLERLVQRLQTNTGRWKDEDLQRYGDGGRRAPRFPPGVEEALRQARAQVDESAYRSGWTAAVRDIWRAVRPVLQ